MLATVYFASCLACLLWNTGVLYGANVGGIIRSGPTLSSTQPHWRLGVSFDYAFKQAAVGIGIDMMVSYKPYVSSDHDDLRLNVFGYFAELRWNIKQSDNWMFGAGATVGARSVAYENSSNNSFNPTDWVPSVPDSPIGSTMHFVIGPFLQTDYVLAPWVNILGRVGYDQHFGPDYLDVTAAGLSGLFVQLGFRIAISES